MPSTVGSRATGSWIAVRRLAPRAPRAAGLALAAILLGGVSHAALAGERHALLIGNSAYESLPPLDNPALDATLLARTLERLDFSVQVVGDASYDGMRAAIDVFRQAARGAEVALVYYAGHGVQVDGVNYLLPVNAQIRGREDLRREGLVLPFLLHELETASPEFGILVLDACRDNPIAALEEQLAQQAGRSMAPREGLAPTISATGLLISYATAPGQVALDGPAGGNSPFAEALAHYLDEPGLEIGLLFRKVSARVREATAGAQVPWTEASLTGKSLVLNPAPTRPDQEDAIAELNRALDLDDPLEQRLALARFTRAHQGSPFAQLAAAYLARLDVTGPAPGIQLAGFEQSVADRHRVELVADSVAGPLATEVFAALHAPDEAAAGAAPEPATPPQPVASRQPDASATTVAPPSDAASLLWPMIAAADQPDYYAQFLALFPNDANAGSAAAGLAFAALTDDWQLPAAAPPADAAPAPLLVSVVVGTGPVTIPLPATERSLVLHEPPRHGRLRAVDEAGNELPLGATPVAPAALEYLPPLALRQGVDALLLGLVDPAAVVEEELAALPDEVAAELEPAAVEPPAAADGAAGAVRQERDLAVLADDAAPLARSLETVEQRNARLAAAGEPYPVQFEITVHACDQLAGTPFDRQGVVLGVFGNAIDTSAAIPACEAAIAAHPGVPRFVYQLGRAVEEGGDHARAAELYEEAAAAGHVMGIYRLGYLYLVGRGTPVDVTKAVTFFEAAAAKGESYAMNSLARLYAAGDGVPQDKEKAIDLFLQAAAQGNTYAYNNLGYLLAEDGEADRALPLFQASAEAGDVYGYNNMGYAYQRGIGVEPDLEQAIGWYERAAKGGQPNAPINLGFIYRQGGPGLAPDPQRAAFWFAEAASGGNPWGSVHLATLHAQGEIGPAPDPAQAAKLLARVAWIDSGIARHAAEQNFGGAGDAARERFAGLPQRAVVEAVQGELASHGFDPGPADGLPGPRTEAAIAAFLAARDLPRDLAPIDLLAELLRSPRLEE
jgi:TPR repeat protein